MVVLSPGQWLQFYSPQQTLFFFFSSTSPAAFHWSSFSWCLSPAELQSVNFRRRPNRIKGAYYGHFMSSFSAFNSTKQQIRFHIQHSTSSLPFGLDGESLTDWHQMHVINSGDECYTIHSSTILLCRDIRWGGKAGGGSETCRTIGILFKLFSCLSLMAHK